jgi:hypothetical protein
LAGGGVAGDRAGVEAGGVAGDRAGVEAGDAAEDLAGAEVGDLVGVPMPLHMQQPSLIWGMVIPTTTVRQVCPTRPIGRIRIRRR